MERRVFAAIVILLGYNTALAALPDAVANAMARHRLDPSHLSVAVRPVDGGPALAAHNAAVLRNPASTIKVLTTFAALHQLGPTYTWETHALVAGGLRNGQLAGPLILRGEGDPFLVTEQLYKLLLQVRVRGVREIQGGLILDDSYFRLPEGDPGAFDGNAHRPYNVLPGALVVNFQTTRLTLVPQDGGRRGLILADPPASNLTVVDNLTWTEGHCRGKRLHVTIDHEDRGGRVVVGGRYPRACGEDEIYRSVATASAMTFGVVDALWQHLGGELRGGWRRARTPPNAPPRGPMAAPALAAHLGGGYKKTHKIIDGPRVQHLGG
ncbi:MAG: D-alanyl-D-alanine carboxypeptidase/D-alanyl-D-alanine-endopeptidase, partial [Candidatus Competibacterales bacterium]